MAQLNSNQLSNEYYLNGARAEASAFLTSQVGVPGWFDGLWSIYLQVSLIKTLFFNGDLLIYVPWECG
jgi:hypothetical protein